MATRIAGNNDMKLVIGTPRPGLRTVRRGVSTCLALRNNQGLTNRQLFRVADIFFVRLENLFPMLG